jgi:ATP-dependent HslUV protease ATP-binding subunit HslU
VEEFTPREIVAELDMCIGGQDEAKRAVAIAIRNRWRRQNLPPEMRDEVAPKNIIMIGPTGVGKTEIARRLAQLVQAPFLKVEASKYTEVGYHGRDVESMVRDLVELSVNMARVEEMHKVDRQAVQAAEDRLLDLQLPAPETILPEADSTLRREQTRAKLRQKLIKGELDDRTIELAVEEKGLPGHVFAAVGMEPVDFDFQNIFEKILPTRNRERRVSVKEARRLVTQQEAEKLLDKEKLTRSALKRAEDSGIIFLDELDKIASTGSEHGPDVSRQGVQRDLLPIIEGSTVPTRHGLVHTGHILFVAAGAFHMTKPSDLIPELQGRFPIRVELSDLGKEEFVRILTEPRNALVKQYQALLETEEVKLEFAPDAIDEIAEVACEVNRRSQNIGARRLHTVMEKLLEETSFNASELRGKTLKVDRSYVREKLQPILKDEDLSRYIL